MSLPLPSSPRASINSKKGCNSVNKALELKHGHNDSLFVGCGLSLHRRFSPSPPWAVLTLATRFWQHTASILLVKPTVTRLSAGRFRENDAWERIIASASSSPSTAVTITRSNAVVDVHVDAAPEAPITPVDHHSIPTPRLGRPDPSHRNPCPRFLSELAREVTSPTL
jgi:hypothetical protein